MRLLPLVLLATTSGHGQDITIRVLDDQTLNPVRGISVLLRQDCQSPNRPKAVIRKTNSSGETSFSSISLSGKPICVNLHSIAYRYAPHTMDIIFVAPSEANRYKSLNPIATTLPAIETFHVQKRSFWERLIFLFQDE